MICPAEVSTTAYAPHAGRPCASAACENVSKNLQGEVESVGAGWLSQSTACKASRKQLAVRNARRMGANHSTNKRQAQPAPSEQASEAFPLCAVSSRAGSGEIARVQVGVHNVERRQQHGVYRAAAAADCLLYSRCCRLGLVAPRLDCIHQLGCGG